MKKCYKCQTTKPKEDFSKNKRYKDGLHDICKSCKKENNALNKDKIREYYNKNIEKNKEYNKKYTLNNKDKIKEYNKKYYSDPVKRKSKLNYIKEYNANPENKKKHQDYIKSWFDNNPNYLKEYMVKKYKSSVLFKIKSNLKSRFHHAIVKGRKNKSITKLLGCSIEEFKVYLEQQFKPEMNWNNHGTIWEIDHIIGCCNFDLTKLEEQQRCFHYTNMQPLFKTTKIAEQHGYKNETGNRDKKKSI